MDIESEFSASYRLFANDALGQNPVISYTFAIRALLLSQMGFGPGVVIHGVYRWGWASQFVVRVLTLEIALHGALEPAPAR